MIGSLCSGSPGDVFCRDLSRSESDVCDWSCFDFLSGESDLELECFDSDLDLEYSDLDDFESDLDDFSRDSDLELDWELSRDFEE